ncbi:hypothetical protein RM844_29635 [Streptomyces sp. DSM 44915]|uniref:Uncharacterized protein n=1 Tax=Streptomyces chisholmiae TaxID=3075540 RepID=A0ABU2K040_9ACTN|nr:hypothetical protein [Streptomyces sp. DSM 44915]MDT0270442.1 hypothetical protein [Streptomyces sp. DSM 44915]
MTAVETAELERALERAVDRLRRLPESRLRRGAAARGRALADELTRRAQLLEQPHQGGTRRVPDAGLWAVGDQITVTGHDLTRAIRHTGDPERATRELAEALRLVAEFEV